MPVMSICRSLLLRHFFVFFFTLGSKGFKELNNKTNFSLVMLITCFSVGCEK